MEAPDPLSAKNVGTFAHGAMTGRLPVIMDKVIKTVTNMRGEIKERHGEKGTKELEAIVSRLVKLKDEVVTDKEFVLIHDQRPDAEIWNNYLRETTAKKGTPPRWFSDPWLYVECYMYRRIMEAIFLSPEVSYIDPFKPMKQASFTGSEQAMITLLKHAQGIFESMSSRSLEDNKNLFFQFLQVTLWGNKCDMSLSIGAEVSQEDNPLQMVDTLRPKLLTDNIQETWDTIKQTNNKRVDFVLDNSGFELVADLTLAEFLIDSNLAEVVYFHGKAMPWFLSDTTKKDLDWTLKKLANSNNDTLAFFGKKWQDRFENGSFVFTENMFWSFPQDYSLMKTVSPELYNELANSKLIFFKGDLNYRKITSDRHWDTTTKFQTSLRGFHPAPLVCLRAVKVDCVVGLKPGQAEACRRATGNDWWYIGEYAVIQHCAIVA